MSKSFPELILPLTVAGRQLLGLCTSGARGEQGKGALHGGIQKELGS